MIHRAILRCRLSYSLNWTPAFADTVSVLLVKARAAESKGDTELALRMAQAAIVADPARHALLCGKLAGIYAKDHQFDFARAYYDEALSIDPSRLEVAAARR